MNDFFNYSAMSIQNSMSDVDITNPPSSVYQDNALYALRKDLENETGSGSKRQNIFAIAKVGLPNLILPSSLDIKISNFNSYSSYLQLCDNFF